jgi:hypothetical protein
MKIMKIPSACFLNISESSFYSISILYKPKPILKRGKENYACNGKAFLCYFLIFPWEKYSKKLLKYNYTPKELIFLISSYGDCFPYQTQHSAPVKS